MNFLRFILHALELIHYAFVFVLYLWHRRDLNRFLYQLYKIGVQATGLVLIIGIFTGAIISWQAAYQFKGIISLSIMGGQVTKVIFTEIGPVLTALILSGRIGTSIAAEIGTMKIGNQIDSLVSLNIDLKRYLTSPRILASFVMMPVLTIFSNLTAIFGAFVVSHYFLEQTFTTFFTSITDFYDPADLYKGLIKAAIFGLLISSIGCTEGFAATRGAESVGDATINAFVKSALMILLVDFAVWLIIF